LLWKGSRRDREMVDHEMALVLIGATIGVVGALVGAVVGALVQHFLSLRADRVRRERDREEKESERQRETLLAGADEVVVRPAIAHFGERGDFISATITDAAGRNILIVEKEEGTQEEEQDEPAE
jgi:hypothetical protein